MIYRLTYCNKDGVEARVDIQKGLATPVIEVEGTGRPFILSYNNDKGDKSGMFLSSSADIEIYETSEFNIDNLKTSNETELTVTHYIDNVVSWKGFIIPDFFSIEVRNNPVITMTASDRLGTLKNVTLSDLPSMVNLRELAILCLNKTGLSIPLRTMADFNNGTGINDFFNSKILTQRLSDTKGRSISCYDILSSILTASNSFLVQRSGGWHIINKIQHEAGSGKLYTGERTFVNWSDVIFNFSDISTGGRRTIIPVASTVGVYHEHGGGRLHPDNYDFSKGLTGWSAVGDFTASIDNRQIDGFQTQGGQAGYFPIYGAATENSYLVNYNQYERNVNPKYLESAEINIPYNGNGAIEVEVDVNATGPLTYPGSSFAPATLRISVVAVSGTETLTLDHGGKFIPMPSTNPPIFSKDFGKALPINDVYKADSIGMKVKGTLEVGSLENYKLKVRIYGGTGGRTILVNMVSLSMKNTQELPKGNIYKTEKGDNFTKAHDIDTSLFGDYLTAGLNGYFYDYPIDDTSSLYNSSNELTSKWTAYNDTEQLPLLQHITRQKSRLFSVAHDLLSAEIEVNNFDPLAIFVACEKRYTVVSAQFDFFKSNLSVELEEVAFQSASVRDFIYSYFGDGESGIKSIGGISGGSGGGGTGGGLTPEQLEILSFWKKDPDNPDTIFTEMNAYSTKELSAYGLGEGSGGGGGSLVVWGTESNGTIPLTVEGVSKTIALKSGLDLKQDKLIAGSGITITGNTISANIQELSWDNISGKPATFAPSAHTHAISDITGLQTALNSKLETSIFNTHNNDNVRHITGAERTKWNGVVTDFNNLEIGGRNLAWKSDTLRVGLSGTGISRVMTTDGYLQVTTLAGNGRWHTGWTSSYGVIESSLNEGDDFTVSLVIKRVEGVGKPTIYIKAGMGYYAMTGDVSEDFSTIHYTGKWKKLYPIDIHLGWGSTVGVFIIKCWKLEKGNKVTDWTPAPEDQVSDWLTTDVNSFSYIKNKPTKLSDFTDNIGIGAHIANNVIHITATERTNWNDANTKKHTHPNKPVIDQLTQADINVLAKLSLVDGNLKVNTNLYSTGEVSAYGIGSGSGGGGGGSLVSWGTEANSFIPLTVEGISKTVALQGHTHTKAQIGLGNVDNTSDLNKPISTAAQIALNSKFDNPTGTTSQYIRGDGSLATYTDTTYSLMSLAELNTGTATTNRVVNSKNLNDWLNGKNYALSNHTHTFASLTSKPTTLSGYGITDATSLSIFNSHNNDNVRHITGAERTKWDKVVTDFGNFEIGGRNLLVKNAMSKGYYDASGVLTASGDVFLSGYIEVHEGKSYTAKSFNSRNNTGGRVVFFDVDKTYISRGGLNIEEVFIIPAGVSYIRYQSDKVGGVYVDDAIIVAGNKAPTDWSPAPEDQVSDWNTTDVNSFSFIKNKPTKLSDFTDNIGIGAHIANNVIHITGQERTNWNLAYSERHTHPNKPVIDQLTQADINVLAKLSLVDGNLKVDTNLYSTGEVSAYGIGSGSGGGGGGSLVSWGTEANSFIPLVVEGISKTVALLGHTHTFASLTSKPTTLSGYGITDATPLFTFNTHNNDNVRHITSAERTKWNEAYGWGDFRDFGLGANYNILDLDDQKNNSIGFTSALTANSVMPYGGVFRFGSGTSYVQLYGEYEYKQDLHFRRNRNGVFDDWRKLWHDGNLTSLSQLTDNIGVATHIANTSNPHNVTKAQVGLGNVLNVASYSKTESDTALTLKLNKSVFDDMFEKVEVSTGVFAIKAKYNFYGVGEVSAYGIGSGGGSGGGGGIIETVYGYSNLGQTFNNATLTDTFNAYTINQINTRLVSVENGSATTVNTTGTGNAITSISKAGTVITANKDLTFSLLGHTHPISDITNLQTTLNNKLETSIFNSHNADNVRHITGAERTKWDAVVTDFEGLEIGGRNLLTNSKKITTFGRKYFTDSSKTITISFDLEILDDLGDSGQLAFFVYGDGVSLGRHNYYISDALTGRYSLTISYDTPIASVHMYTDAGNTGTERSFIYHNFKVEKGNKATDWSPAPEDQVSDWLTTDVNSFSYIKNKPTLLSQFTDNIGVATHIANTSNPHSVTKAQVGLGSVDNTSDLLKPISTATQTALNLKANLASPTFTGTVTAPTFIGALSGNATTATTATNLSRSILAGDGLTGGGVLNADRTITLGTPSNITLSSTNSVTTASHTHNLALGGTSSQYLNGATALVTIPTITAGNGLTGGGQLTASQTLTLGTPSTLTASTTNAVTAGSHTHAITTTSVGLANTIVQTDASGGVRGEVIRIGANWTLELVGTELQVKYNGALKQRFLADGSFVATGEVTAYE